MNDPRPARHLTNPGSIPMRESLRALNEALARGRELIVCQVVETKGSTPQKAGALMIVDPDGGQHGTLGGGCVENEVKMRAISRIGREGTQVHSFVLDHDYAWADGLICGGKMVVTVESVRSHEALDYYRAFEALLEGGDGFTEAVVIGTGRWGEAEIGARVLFDDVGSPIAWLRATELVDRLRSGLIPLADRPKSGVREGVAYLPRLPRVRLVIVGAGHVGQAVANLAAQADFDVWVVDDRHQYANQDRFPTADRLVVGPLDEALGSIEVDERTYAVIVTRGHGHDQEALALLAPTVAPYVGLIGSRRKIRLIFESLREAGITETALSRVAAPVGIDIGSETVVEIAVSIVAELIARRNLGDPSPLSIPAKPETAGA